MAPAAHCDFLVMGAGVAGLRAALDLAAEGNVLVVTKESVRESNTHYAQGGIAVAEPDPGDVALHLDDTVAAGDLTVDVSDVTSRDEIGQMARAFQAMTDRLRAETQMPVHLAESPPTRIDWLTTIPPSEITATSVVPPPMSTIMFPVASDTGRPAPIAAAIGS